MGTVKMLRMRESVVGMREAPKKPMTAGAAMRRVAVGGERSGDGGCGEADAADEKDATPPPAVAERAHGDEEPGQHEGVDFHGPQQLVAGGFEGGGDFGQGEGQHGVVHGDEKDGQHEYC
nr:hypothetical protein [Trueperella pecoris]